MSEVAGSQVDGCVGLVSSGTSGSESAFLDASEDGGDVFFVTAGKLVSEDYDNAYDVYDAHVCTSQVPCVPVAVSPPPCESSDSCKGTTSPQPLLFGAPPSATFNGIGNIPPATPKTPAVKKLTRGQHLARALKACHKEKHRQRQVCEQTARRRYQAGTKTGPRKHVKRRAGR